MHISSSKPLRHLINMPCKDVGGFVKYTRLLEISKMRMRRALSSASNHTIFEPPSQEMLNKDLHRTFHYSVNHFRPHVGRDGERHCTHVAFLRA